MGYDKGLTCCMRNLLALACMAGDPASACIRSITSRLHVTRRAVACIFSLICRVHWPGLICDPSIHLDS